MDYDPIKDRLGGFFWRTPLRTRLFYRLLDTVFLRSWYVRRHLRMLIQAKPSNRRLQVLDAGTGFGQYAYFLVSRFPHVDVTAVDVKQEYLDRAQAFFEQTPYRDCVRFAQRDLTEPPPPEDEGRYDLILSVDVMEHIEDDRAVFRGFEQMLRPGGSVIVNTPSDLGGSGVTEEGEESFIGEHVRDGYPLAELTEKLTTAGLPVATQTYTYGPLGSAAWKMLVKLPISLLNKSWAWAPFLAVYYLPALPAGMALNAVDIRHANKEGTGLLVVAGKPA